jgi:colanic acid biosynthesis protein WcaH
MISMKHPLPRRVPRAAFRTLVRWAPIVSIDLIILNRAGEVLLGYRTNRPARNTWFVPGGRVFKGERIASALARIARQETGIEARASSAAFAGAFEHFYRNSIFGGARSLPTHYVVLAFVIRVKGGTKLRADSQHRRLEWFSRRDVLRMGSVHGNTKAYFRPRRRAAAPALP